MRVSCSIFAPNFSPFQRFEGFQTKGNFCLLRDLRYLYSGPPLIRLSCKRPAAVLGPVSIARTAFTKKSTPSKLPTFKRGQRQGSLWRQVDFQRS